MLGKLSELQIERFLESQIVGRIGCHANGETYVVPISYAYDGTYIYAHTYEGKKLDMMREEPRICFEVDTLGDLSEWKSVIGWGEFEELKDPDERKHALQILMDRNLPILSSVTMHLSPDWPFHSDDTDYTDGVVFRIKLVDKTGRFETNVASPAFAG